MSPDHNGTKNHRSWHGKVFRYVPSFYGGMKVLRDRDGFSVE